MMKHILVPLWVEIFFFDMVKIGDIAERVYY